jgi:hypothetical protein
VPASEGAHAAGNVAIGHADLDASAACDLAEIDAHAALARWFFLIQFRMASAVASVTVPPAASRFGSFELLTARWHNVLGAIPIDRAAKWIS